MTSLTASGWQLSRFKKRSKMPHPTTSLLYISWTVWARITEFYRHIHADLPYICTEYDVTTYFRSEATAEKTVENAASVFSTLRLRVKGGRGGSGVGPFDSPPIWLPISSPLTHMVYLLLFSSYSAGSKSVSVLAPVRHGYNDDKYCSRRYRFIERQKFLTVLCVTTK